MSLTQSVADEMAALERTLGGLYGPRGGCAIFASGPGSLSVRVASASARVLPQLAHSALPAGAWATPLLLSLLQPQSSQRGAPSPYEPPAPGGLFAHLLAAALVRRGSRAVEQGTGLSRVALAQALEDVRARIEAQLSGHTQLHAWERRVALASAQDLHAVLLSAMSAKRAALRCSRESLESIAGAVLKACISSLPADLQQETRASSLPPGPHVYFRTVPGMDPVESHAVEGVLVEALHTLPQQMPLLPLLGCVRLALFTCSLAGGLAEEGAIGEHSRIVVEESEGSAVDRAARAGLLDLARRLVADQVGILVCQRAIHPSLKRYLSEHGVFVIERVGIRSVEPLSAVSAATPCSLAAASASLLQSHYGCVSTLSLSSFNGHEFLRFCPCEEPCEGAKPHDPARGAPFTLVLGGDDEDAAEELAEACASACRAFHALFVEDPVVLPGGGCAELLLADVCESNDFARGKGGGTLVLAARITAAALRDTVRCLIRGHEGHFAPTVGPECRELEEALVQQASRASTQGNCKAASDPEFPSHGCPQCFYGVGELDSDRPERVMRCPECRRRSEGRSGSGEGRDVASQGREDERKELHETLDLRRTKREAICAALRAAGTVLRIACAVRGVDY